MARPEIRLEMNKIAEKRRRLGYRRIGVMLERVALNHHAMNAVTKHFQLFSGPRGMSNVPPTLEELEANYAAVFLQCGVALEDLRWDSAPLASRAFSDIEYVKLAQRAVRLEVFQRELRRPRQRYPRVIL